MPGQLELERRLGELAARVNLLEEKRRAVLDALELAASSGDFQAQPGSYTRAEEVLRDATEHVRRLIPFESVCFWLVDEETADLVPAFTDPPEDQPFLTAEFERLADERLVSLAMQRQRTVLAASSREGRRLIVHVLATAKRVRGLMVGCVGPNLAESGDAAQAMVTILLQSAAATLEGMELYRLLRQRNEALSEGLRKLAAGEERLRREVKARKDAQRRLELMAQVFAGSREAILVTDARGRIVEVNPAFSHITGWEGEEAKGKSVTRLLSDSCGRDLSREIARHMRERSLFAGEIICQTRVGQDFPALVSASAVLDEEGAATNYVAVFRDISEYKAKEEQIRFQAHHDALTGLPNRALLLDRLEHALSRAGRMGNRVGIFFLDVDDFKRINDSMGHPVGDELLRNVATRLSLAMRASDTVARLGGDEFVVMCEDLRDEGDAVAMCERIGRLFRQSFAAGGVEHHLTTSIGVTVYPEDGEDPHLLIRNADLAMYRAKESGKGRWHLYTRQLSKLAMRRLRMERLLRGAVQRSEIEVHYQPQVDILSGRITGVEALARWRRKGRLILPMEFIPLAEESGLIGDIGEEVLRQACTQAASWNGAATGLRLAVNVSPRQIEQGDLARTVGDCLDKTGFPADRLELEITETALMQSEDRVRRVLNELRAMGVQVAIDDFGTGYSSLSHLRHFPIKALKIDRGFVTGLPGDQNNASIVEAILSMAKSLGLTVVAEGIESLAHLDFLRGRGCDSYQGFYYSRPVPSVDFQAMLLHPDQAWGAGRA